MVNCNQCKKYEVRIKELEKINDLHRRLNGELRESVSTVLQEQHIYLSECCNALPSGELDSKDNGASIGEYYRLGFCSQCKDNSLFVKVDSGQYS